MRFGAMLVEGFVELVAPTRCAGCDLPGSLLCERCRTAMTPIDQTRACARCGAPGGSRWCGECPGQDLSYAMVRCAGVFAPPLSRCITLFKDAGELRLAPLLAEIAFTAVSDWAAEIDCVVPVPPSPGAIARRGFDHTAVVACDLARSLGVPAVDALVCLPRRDQRILTRHQRLRNAAGSMRAAPGVTSPDRVLLFDDVLTTGATLDAASRALLSAGTAEVRAVTVGRACG